MGSANWALVVIQALVIVCTVILMISTASAHRLAYRTYKQLRYEYRVAEREAIKEQIRDTAYADGRASMANDVRYYALWCDGLEEENRKLKGQLEMTFNDNTEWV